MTIYNIIIRENGHDIFTVTQSPSEKYVSFDLGANSAYVSTYVWTLLNQNSILPSAAAADLMDLAIAIYTSDQIISREINGFQGWSRHIKIHFPVSDLIVWNGVKSELELMLSFLSGDKWEIIFRDRTIPRNIQPPLIRNPEGITKVSLLSGGLDSFIGAIDLLEKKEKVAFVSHYKRGAESPRQTHVYAALTKQYGTASFKDYKFFVQPNQKADSFS